MPFSTKIKVPGVAAQDPYWAAASIVQSIVPFALNSQKLFKDRTDLFYVQPLIKAIMLV